MYITAQKAVGWWSWEQLIAFKGAISIYIIYKLFVFIVSFLKGIRLGLIIICKRNRQGFKP